jgi:hypothetical protein
MAVYEPRGPQVALRGPQQGTAFAPQQAYDPSQALSNKIERQAAVQTQALEQTNRALNFQNQIKQNEIEALTSFSETLFTNLKERTKAQAENEYNLGVADVLNGTVELNPAFKAKYQQEVGMLQKAAESDGQVINNLTQQGQVEVAEQFKSESRSISGWRAYGQAVGLAKRAANNSQAAMLAFMEQTEQTIPLPDGRFIAPSQASTPAEINAVLEVAQASYVQAAGVTNINPVILAEHLAPTLQNIRSQVFANKIQEVSRKNRETAVSDTDGEVQGEFSNPDQTVDGLFESYQRSVTDYQVKGGLSRGAAADRAMEGALNAISTMPQDIAEDLLDKLSQVRKIADDPNSITLGAAYADSFDKTINEVRTKADQAAERQDRELDRNADKAMNILERARQDVNLPADQLKNLRQETIGILGTLADQGSEKALQMRGQLLAEPTNVDYTLYQQYRQGISQGLRPSERQLEADYQNGRLTEQMYSELKNFAEADSRGGFNKQFGDDIDKAVKAHLEAAGALSLDPFGNPDKHPLHVRQISNDLTTLAYNYWLSNNKQVDDNDINQFVLSKIPSQVSKYFRQDPTTKGWTPKPLSRNPNITGNYSSSAIAGRVRDASGFDPRTIQLRSYTSGQTMLMSKGEVEDNIQRLQSNQPLTSKAQALSGSNGGAVRLLTHQAQHYGIDPSPILSTPEARRLAEYSTVAPRAAQRYATSGNNPQQQLLQLRRIVEAQQRARRRVEVSGKGTQPTTDLKPGSVVGINDYLRLAMDQGLSSEEAVLMAAVGMAESTGQSGVRNLNPGTGDDSYGLWQINMIGDLGPQRLRSYGLTSAEDLKDPETNARVMSGIFKAGGKNAWGSYRDKRYLQYMGEARRAYAELQRSGFNSARGGRANFSPTNVQSIRIETPGNSFQPGMDLWFADKQFGAVLPGRVKEIRRNNGNYGNMIVVESTDPATGDTVDVLYAHLDSINVREGESVRPGFVLGKQGGSGRVRSADGTIASIDFLAPAPAGSNAMTPYRNWQRLASRIKQQIEAGTFR